jgi:hypothetical protein
MGNNNGRVVLGIFWLCASLVTHTTGDYQQQQQFKSFCGAFSQFRKAIISFVMSVCMEQLGSHRTDFHEILYLSIL